MGELLLYYKRPDPTTWVYLSSFLTLGLFFVFHRVWSIRNLDLVLLILLGPGILMVYQGYRQVEEETAARILIAQQQADLASSQPNQIIAARDSETSQESGGSTTQLQSEEPPIASAPLERAAPNTEADLRTNEAESNTSDAGSTEIETDAQKVEDDSKEKEAVGQKSTAFRTADIQRKGFLYLFAIEFLILVRLIIDPLMVRRPRLDPNLTIGGLTFIGISLFVFIMANVVSSNAKTQVSQGPALGPGYSLMNMLPAIPTRPIEEIAIANFRGSASMARTIENQNRLAGVAKIMAILAHLAIVSGIVLISNKHFGNLRAGMGCATLYLLLPYTAQMTGRVDHVLPAALLLWAVMVYRRPMLAGLFLGLAGGLVYYPLFLLPLWISFYWLRGLRQFLIGVVSMLAVLMLLLSLDNSQSLVGHLQQMFGIMNPLKPISDLRGFWALGWQPIWRLPVIVGFVILSIFFAIWPAQKNLGTLLSASAAVMVAAQFWHGYGGGLYIAWFLPILLLTVFRPNLQDRVAIKVVRTPAPPSASVIETLTTDA
jgi:hypothetical protein